jgi:hypothetical protein
MLEKKQLINKLESQGREIYPAQTGDQDLGPLQLLPGTWKNEPNLPGRGWNMIALPFATAPSPLDYRLLVNQYNEELKFTLVDKAVPNRGIQRFGVTTDADQFLVALDYEQIIRQIAAEDSPVSGKAGPADLPIHHEPGLWLNMTNEITDSLNIARLATIPHGDSVLALGASSENDGVSSIFDINGLPIGVDQDIDSPYLAPYKHFHENLFKGLFDPTSPNDLLTAANQGVDIVKTTILSVDTDVSTAGIHNIPFIVRQANATVMKSTFWIQELAEKDRNGNPKLRLQYSQLIMLEFFPRRDGFPGLIQWPHVSINTLEKVVPDDDNCAKDQNFSAESLSTK